MKCDARPGPTAVVVPLLSPKEILELTAIDETCPAYDGYAEPIALASPVQSRRCTMTTSRTANDNNISMNNHNASERSYSSIPSLVIDVSHSWLAPTAEASPISYQNEPSLVIDVSQSWLAPTVDASPISHQDEPLGNDSASTPHALAEAIEENANLMSSTTDESVLRELQRINEKLTLLQGQQCEALEAVSALQGQQREALEAVQSLRRISSTSRPNDQKSNFQNHRGNIIFKTACSLSSAKDDRQSSQPRNIPNVMRAARAGNESDRSYGRDRLGSDMAVPGTVTSPLSPAGSSLSPQKILNRKPASDARKVIQNEKREVKVYKALNNDKSDQATPSLETHFNRTRKLLKTTNDNTPPAPPSLVGVNKAQKPYSRVPFGIDTRGAAKTSPATENSRNPEVSTSCIEAAVLPFKRGEQLCSNEQTPDDGMTRRTVRPNKELSAVVKTSGVCASAQRSSLKKQKERLAMSERSLKEQKTKQKSNSRPQRRVKSCFLRSLTTSKVF